MTNTTYTPKLWRDMTDAEKGALLLAEHEGKMIEVWANGAWYSGIPHWSDEAAYRVKPEPVRKTVDYWWRNDEGIKHTWGFGDTHRITFDLLDGKPDCTSIKMEKIP